MIKRKITTTTVEGVTISLDSDNVPEIENLPLETIKGKLSKEQAQKMLNKKYGKPVEIISYTQETKEYIMSVETFIENSSVTNDNESQEE